MRHAGWVVTALAIVLTSCVRTSVGVPVAGETGTPGAGPSTSTGPSTSAGPSPSAEPGSGSPEPGIVPTTRTPVPAGATTCAAADPPPVGVVASVDDPAAPKITVALPAGWATTKGEGDVGAKLTGPDGLWATVTIAKTPLDPAAAFGKYVDDAMAASSISSVSVLPAELCGYSGQKLLGSWSRPPQQAVEFGDRIAHIWTNTDNYLVAVHAEGPAGAGLDPFTSPLLGDFTVVIA